MTSTAPILVVDDDPGLRALVAVTLELEGLDVVTAADGRAALGLVEQVEPMMILLDKSMPALDGPEFARELRSRGFDTPIIVISGSDGGRRFANAIHADGFIRKPFQVPQLIDTVQDCMTRTTDDRSSDEPAAGG